MAAVSPLQARRFLLGGRLSEQVDDHDCHRQKDRHPSDRTVLRSEETLGAIADCIRNLGRAEKLFMESGDCAYPCDWWIVVVSKVEGSSKRTQIKKVDFGADLLLLGDC